MSTSATTQAVLTIVKDEFIVSCLIMWGNTLDYKLFDTLYMIHQNNSCTIKKLCEQAMTLLEEANKINDWDILVQ
jgi:hypothetical protein